jgi:hypothetical protein
MRRSFRILVLSVLCLVGCKEGGGHEFSVANEIGYWQWKHEKCEGVGRELEQLWANLTADNLGQAQWGLVRMARQIEFCGGREAVPSGGVVVSDDVEYVRAFIQASQWRVIHEYR